MNRRVALWGACLVLTTIVAGLIMAWHLTLQPVQNWDESIHGQVSRETVKNSNWLDLTYRGGEYFRKPPLSFWLRSLAILALGDGALALRIWSALAGLATTLLLGVWAWQLWKNRWLALLAALMFASGRFVFFHAFRTGESDSLLVLLVTLALYGYWRSWTRPHWLWLTGIATGLAVMTKSAGGMLPALVIGVHLLLSWRWPFRWRNVATAAGLFLVIALPWHLVEWVRHGSQFWQDYVGLHIVERVTEQIHNQGVGTFWYVKIFLERFYPWSLFVPFAVVWAVLRWWKDRRGSEGLFLAWLLTTFIFFTLAKTKFDWYLLPLYPAATLLVTPWLKTLVRDRNVWLTAAHTLSVFGFFWLLPDSVNPASAVRWMFPVSFWTDWLRTPIFLAATAFASAVFFTVSVLPKIPNTVRRVFGGLVLLYFVVFAGVASLTNVRNACEPRSPLPALVAAIRNTGATTLYSKGTDLLRYPAAYWYFSSLPGVALVDLEREPWPRTFDSKTVAVVRGYEQPVISLKSKWQAGDFLIKVYPAAVEDLSYPSSLQGVTQLPLVCNS